MVYCFIMLLYRLNHIFVPFKKVKYYYYNGKKNCINLFFKVLNNNFILFRAFFNCFFFIFQGCFFFISYWPAYTIEKQFNWVKSYTKWLDTAARGLYSYNKINLLIKGLGNRMHEDTWTRSKQKLYLKLGHAHLVFFQKVSFMLFKKHKRKYALTIYSTNKFLLSNFIYILRRFRPPNIYTGNGVLFLKEKIKFKPRKKWGVF